MRNHDQKARDMARSILPSTSRHGARKAKRAVHGAERAWERQLLHALRSAEHPDDVGLDLRWYDRTEIGHVVVERRGYDQVAPLMRWAEAIVDRDPDLAAASPSDRRCYFRSVLGDGLMTDHALFHLEFSVLRLETDNVDRWTPARKRVEATPLVELVQDLVDAGAHGTLNLALKAERHRRARPMSRSERREAKATGGDPWWHPPVEGRLLAGPHDVAAFAAVTASDHLVTRVVRRLHLDLC